ncbi:MAG: hypothetical protein JO312_08870 [Hyphomicrobiales bacterium]|nr:hypothetical protein [Hyphomicrobiales bacterium]
MRGLHYVADARTLVSLTSFSLPLNGLALALVTGVAMTVLRFGVRPPAWVLAKLVLATAIFTNAKVFLFPAISDATIWAALGATQSQTPPEFFAAVAREGGFGALNLVMFLIAGALAIGKPALRRLRRREPARA